MICKGVIEEYDKNIEYLEKKLIMKYKVFSDVGIVIYGTGGGRI